MKVLVLNPTTPEDLDKCFEFQDYVTTHPQLQTHALDKLWNEFSTAYDNYHKESDSDIDVGEKKTRKEIITTQDGKPVYEGDIVYLAYRNAQLEQVVGIRAQEGLALFPSKYTAIFSTYEEALKWASPLLKTHDGVTCYDGDIVYTVDIDNDVRMGYTKVNPFTSGTIPLGWKFFSTLITAQNYSDMYKKQFCMADLIKVGVEPVLLQSLTESLQKPITGKKAAERGATIQEKQIAYLEAFGNMDTSIFNSKNCVKYPGVLPGQCSDQ